MYRVLRDTYPDAHCELDFRTPFELLVATILSAQSTDKGVNAITPALFDSYPDAVAMAGADRETLERLIHSTGFYRSKAEHLLGMATRLVDQHDGEVPSTLRELTALPGVGRKTANVVLGNAFGVPGITPDTHFQRLTRRFGWTSAPDADGVEREIGELFPHADWVMLCHVVIWHGRRRCHARRPACGACPLAARCPSYGEGEIDPTKAQRLVKGEA